MEKLLVIKLGGNIIDDEGKLAQFLGSFASLPNKKILVHGGGKMATRLAAQLNIPQQMVEGRRVTDEETLKIVTMVYAGYINKKIVSSLQGLTCNSIGITGADADAVYAHRRVTKEIDYGFAGDVDGINIPLFELLLELGLAVVVAPLTHDRKGQLLNTNADTMAREIARGLSTAYDTELYYLLEKKGVLKNTDDEFSVIPDINPSTYRDLKASGNIFSGMIPKLDNAFSAIEAGIKKVVIGHAEDLAGLVAGNAGTRISGEAPARAIPPFSSGPEGAVSLLKELISTPSFSREEAQTAGIIMRFLEEQGCKPKRVGNNIYEIAQDYDPKKPTLLLNSHHDTVRPNSGYTLDPFNPVEKDGKLFGLGSNDAGGCLVSLLMTFLNFYNDTNREYNLVFIASAEEEISGKDGFEACQKELPPIDCAIVGEPTQMQMAIAERGLMVLDCVAAGKAGHAGRNEGDNALHTAVTDIAWLRSLEFARVSELLGPVQLNITVMETKNKAHNIVPAECHFVVDARVNELYTLEEVLEIIRAGVKSQVTPRSLRLRPTSISIDHPLVEAGLALGRTCFGSPTTSDKALMPYPALKMGPGDSARSHMADEYIYIEEIGNAIDIYTRLLNNLKFSGKTSQYEALGKK